MKTVYAIATMDTKAQEIAYVAECLRNAGVVVKTVDAGTLTESSIGADIDRETVLGQTTLPTSGDRGDAISAMSVSLTDFLTAEVREQKVAGVIGIGGSGGTALITAAMRALPIGFPKLMVSTVASGNTAEYVDCSDITMMFSVVDVAGLNTVSHKVLANAAHAMAGMVANQTAATANKPCLGMTMFGVTTKCVTAVREAFEIKGYDVLVFHATGTGGRAMEGLVRSGLIQGVADLTTTEVADEVVGGIFAAGPKRFDSLIDAEVPLVLSVGAVDMVNFGGMESVPERFRLRNLHVHNAQVTLMRTSVEENVAIAKWIAAKLNKATSPFSLLLPEGGVSMLDVPGGVFHDPAADTALFETLEAEIQPAAGRQILRSGHNINDPQFSDLAVNQFQQLLDL